MSAAIREKAEKWLQSNLDRETKHLIEDLLKPGNENELAEAFYKDLEFGTGGLRGIMGAGSNRVNKYTIGMATQGLSNYLIKCFPNEQIKVAVSYDCRNNSQKLAQVVADVFSANGILVYLFESLRPTPELSFSVRELGCHSGVMLTASHNPKEYNGYKAYWSDGAQMVEPHDQNVMDEVTKITSIDEVNFEGNDDLIELLGEEMDELYLDRVLKTSLDKELINRHKDLKIVFTPIHGTAIMLVPQALANLGFEQVHIVEEQAQPDGNFPTVIYPNPEEAEALTMALNKAKEIDADIVMATDPDADRVGIAAKNQKGEFELINGNQTATLLTYYLLKKWQEKGKLDGNQFVVKTIVTTYLIDAICEGFKVDCYNTLTGFKHIAAVIRELEGKKKFIGGGEESYGYMIGDFVRDKDAISACTMIAELAAYAKDQQMNLFDMLADIYKQFGFFQEHLISITKKGMKGAEEIQEMMARYRSNPPASLGGSPVVALYDYKTGEKKDLKTGSIEKLDFPSSNVLQFYTADGSIISARPSGTEPKIKFYFSVRASLHDKNDYDKVKSELLQKIEKITTDLNP